MFSLSKLAEHEVLGTKGQLLTFTVSEALEAISALREELEPILGKSCLEYSLESGYALIQAEPTSYPALVELSAEDLRNFWPGLNRLAGTFFKNLTDNHNAKTLSEIYEQVFKLDTAVYEATYFAWRVRAVMEDWDRDEAKIRERLNQIPDIDDYRLYIKRTGKPTSADVAVMIIKSVRSYIGRHAYNPRELLLIALEDATDEEKAGLFARVSQFEDTQYMLDMTRQFGIRIAAKRVTDKRVIDSLETQRVPGANGHLDSQENDWEDKGIIRVFQPLPYGTRTLSYGATLLTLSHELRHGGRHNDPEMDNLWPVCTRRPQNQRLSGPIDSAEADMQNLLRTKIQEAEAATFHTASAYILLDKKEHASLDAFYQEDLRSFSEKIEASLQRGLNFQQSFTLALRHTFIETLANQPQYEGQLHYALCINSPSFPVAWRKIVDQLDMAVLEKMTHMQYIDGSYIKGDDPEVKVRIQASLLQTIPVPKRKRTAGYPTPRQD